jgi:hypothetical protein
MASQEKQLAFSDVKEYIFHSALYDCFSEAGTVERCAGKGKRE